MYRRSRWLRLSKDNRLWDGVDVRAAAIYLAGLTLFGPAGSVVAQVVVTPVAVTGGAAPGGGTYSGVGARPVIGHNGIVAFTANTGSTSSGGLFTGPPSALLAFARLGSASPGGAGNYGPFGIPVVSAAGQVATASQLNGPANVGIFAGYPGSVQAVALPGGPAPTGGTYTGLDTPALNTSGTMAFLASMTGGPAAQGIFAGTAGTFQPVAVQGAVAPAGGTYTSGFTDPVLNASGQVAFRANLTGGTATQGIFVGTSGAVQAAAIQGAAAPAGGIYDFLVGSPELNAAGQLAFQARLTGGTATSGLFVGTPGAIQSVALQGQAAPAGGNFGSFYPGNLLINSTGQVAFGANLTGGSATQGLFAGGPGALKPVALQGATAPGGNGAVFSDFGSTNPVINASGYVAFVASLSGPGVTTGNDEALFAGSPGDIQLVARKGDQVDFGTGLGSHTIFAIGLTTLSGGEDGNGLAYNDHNQLVYFLDFTDNKTGVFESVVVPEPSTGVLSLAGFFAFTRISRRRHK
jgi:hypothetical protein